MWKVPLLFRFLIKAYERLLGIFFEGPNLPRRFIDEISLFCSRFPKATREQWINFTIYCSRTSYQQGYLRGLEAVERDREHFPEKVSTVFIAADSDPNWGTKEENSAEVGDIPGPDMISEEMQKMQSEHISKLRVRGRL